MDAAEAAAFVGEAWAAGFPSPLRGGWPEGPAGVTSTGTASFDADEPSRAAEVTPPGRPLPPTLPARGRETRRKPPPRRCLQNPACRAARSAGCHRRGGCRRRRGAGLSVALKAMGVAHKSEAGAVKLNLRDGLSVRAAAEQIVGLGTGLYVERMVQGGVAELIVGVTHDPLFGPVMTLGSGGVMVRTPEGQRDASLALVRGRHRGCAAWAEALSAARGFRGRPRADLAAAVEAIGRIAEFALANAAGSKNSTSTR